MKVKIIATVAIEMMSSTMGIAEILTLLSMLLLLAVLFSILLFLLLLLLW